MNEVKVTTIICGTVLLLIAGISVCIATYEVQSMRHREAMAEMGYEEHYEMLPGKEAPVKFWTKVGGMK